MELSYWGIIMAVLTVMYDSKKYSYDQIIERVVDPFVSFQGRYEDFEEYYRSKRMGCDVNAFEIECKKSTGPKKISEFSKKFNLDLERLARDTYFLRGLRKN